MKLDVHTKDCQCLKSCLNTLQSCFILGEQTGKSDMSIQQSLKNTSINYITAPCIAKVKLDKKNNSCFVDKKSLNRQTCRPRNQCNNWVFIASSLSASVFIQTSCQVFKPMLKREQNTICSFIKNIPENVEKATRNQNIKHIWYIFKKLWN